MEGGASCQSCARWFCASFPFLVSSPCLLYDVGINMYSEGGSTLLTSVTHGHTPARSRQADTALTTGVDSCRSTCSSRSSKRGRARRHGTVSVTVEGSGRSPSLHLWLQARILPSGTVPALQRDPHALRHCSSASARSTCPHAAQLPANTPLAGSLFSAPHLRSVCHPAVSDQSNPTLPPRDRPPLHIPPPGTAPWAAD